MVLEPTFDAAELFVLSGVVALVTVLSYLAFVVVAGKDRSEGPEPRGQAVYVHLVLLISMFVALFAATTVVAALAQLIGTNTASSIFTGNVTLPSSITGLTFPTAISGNTTGYVPLA
ncbi:MAG TPA: hypothetical protein VGS21_07450, partial [Acidimicrobiales bacterium]|nr:hypothetical protein [Acidimicrobiales bacterium]